MDNTLAELLRLILHLSILKQGSFTLAGGRPTSYYFDGRRLSLHPEGARLLGQVMLPIIRRSGALAVGGPATGALPIIAVLTLSSLQDDGPPLPGFYTRKEDKGYGTGQVIEGCWNTGQPVALVDDVCSTGDSLVHAIAVAEAAGCPIVKVLTILDRREGGSKRLRQAGYDFSALFVINQQGEINLPNG